MECQVLGVGREQSRAGEEVEGCEDVNQAQGFRSAKVKNPSRPRGVSLVSSV